MDGERAQLDPRVATVLAAAAAPAEVPLPGEAAALAAFRRVHARRLRRPRLSVTGRVAVAGGLGGLLMAGGVAAAATGALPAAVSFPSHAHHATAGGRSVAPTDAQIPAGYSGEVPYDAPGFGARISDLATSTVTRGVVKGATVCAAASHDTCRAGTHATSGRDAAHRAAAAARHPAASQPAAAAPRPAAHRRAASTPAPTAPPAPAGWTHFRLHH